MSSLFLRLYAPKFYSKKLIRRNSRYESRMHTGRMLRRRMARGLSVIFLIVDAEDAARGDPALAFGGDEFPYPVLADKFEIFDFAHSVFRAQPPNPRRADFPFIDSTFVRS